MTRKFPRLESAGLRGAKAVASAQIGSLSHPYVEAVSNVINAKNEPAEVIAGSIREISEGIRKLRAGRLNDKALLLLLSHASGIGQRQVERVLDALKTLDSTYLKPQGDLKAKSGKGTDWPGP